MPGENELANQCRFIHVPLRLATTTTYGHLCGDTRFKRKSHTTPMPLTRSRCVSSRLAGAIR